MPAAVAAMGLTLFGVTGCHGSCTSTSIGIQPVKAASATAPLDLHARLTSHGKPLVGIRVAFLVLTTGPNNDTGHVIGYGTTDAGGVATLKPPVSLDDALLPGEKVTGYQARFTTVVKINGTSYCDTTGSASLS